MADAYRFGGPIPERAKQLAARRAYRGSQSFSLLKKNRRLDFLENPGPYWKQVRDDVGLVVGVEPVSPKKAQSRAALAQYCTRCGNSRVVLAALISEDANLWRCECGATGRMPLEWRSGEAPPLASSQTAEPLPGSDPRAGEFPR